MSVVPLAPEHCDALLRFFRDLPEGDRTFFKEEVTDPETVRAWTTGGNRSASESADATSGLPSRTAVLGAGSEKSAIGRRTSISVLALRRY